MKKELVHFNHLSCSSCGRTQFEDVCFTVYAGERTGIVTDNMRVIWLLHTLLSGKALPISGEVYIMGVRRSITQATEIFRQMIFFLDGLAYFPSELNVMDLFLISSQDLSGFVIHREKTAKKIIEASSYYGFMLPCLTKKADRLTPLEKCRILILRAVLSGTRIIAVNDLTSFLNQNDRLSLIEDMYSLQRFGVGILLMDHNVSFIRDYADNVFVIQQGRTVFLIDRFSFFSMRSIYCRQDEEYCRQESREDNKRRIHESTLVFEMNKVTAETVKKQDFKLYTGKIAAIADPSSYGGMEIVRIISGSIKIKDGEMRLNGKKYNPAGMWQAIRKGVAFIADYNEKVQSPALLENMTVEDNLALTLAEKRKGMGLRKLRKTIRQECLDFFGKDIARQRVAELDTTDQQRLLYFRWYLYFPAVLVCFHPFAGLDHTMRMVTSEMIKKCAKRGIAVLLIVNAENEARFLCGKNLKIVPPDQKNISFQFEQKK